MSYPVNIPENCLYGGYKLNISDQAKLDLIYLRKVLHTFDQYSKADEPSSINVLNYIVQEIFKQLDIKIIGKI